MFETDDDDFVLSPNSKLSAIFNSSSINDQGNSNLTYKAPKQPKALDNSNSLIQSNSSISSVDGKSGPQSQSAVILAKVINLWKLEDEENKNLGKFMVAIIKNSPTGLHDMIIYQKKDFILIRVVLGKTLTFFKYSNNFLAFNDYRNQLWNLNFNCISDLESFTEIVSKQDCVIVDQNSKSIPEKDSVETSNNKSATASNEKTDSNSRKALILSKITKVGQSILPRTIESTNSSELSESSSDSSFNDSPPVKPAVAPRKPRKAFGENKVLIPILPDTTSTSHMSYFTPHSNQIALNPPNSTGLVYPQPIPDLGLGNYLVAQNAELKANLAEINMKLNTVLQGRDSNGNMKKQEDTNSLQTNIKCQNLKIDNLSRELERCKKSLQKMEEQYKKKCEELDKVMTPKNRAEELDKVITPKNREEELDKVMTPKNQAEELKLMQASLDQLKTDLNAKEEIIKTQSNKIILLEQAHNSSKESLETLKKANQELQSQLDEQETELQEIEQAENERKEVGNRFIRKCLDEAFEGIKAKFNRDEFHSYYDIQMAAYVHLTQVGHKLMEGLW